MAGNLASELEAYAAGYQTAFESDGNVVPYVSDLVVPESSRACPPEARDAHAAAEAFVAEIEELHTFSNWLAVQLAPCCVELSRAY